MQKLYNVGAYIRLSLKDTDYRDGSESIESQKEILSQFIAMMPGWIEKNFYIDNGFSGGNFERPAFQEMLADVRNGSVNLILVKDLSRFGRNYLETGKYLEEELPKLGFRFVALHDNVDTEDGENDIVPFLNGMNDYYLKNLSDRIKTVLTAKVKNGAFLSGETPYGYKRDPENHTHLIVDETSADVVRKIYEMRLVGMGYNSIVFALNSENILPPRLHYCKRENHEPRESASDLWRIATLKKILQYEIYTGDSVRFKRKTKSYREVGSVKRDDDEWVRVANTHEAIIEKDLWEAVQEINRIAKEKTAHYAKPQQTLFSKMLVCADCGGSFIKTATKRTRKDGSEVTHHGYQCRTKRDTKMQCSWHSISQEVLKQIILDDIRNQAKYITLNENRMIKMLQKRLIGTFKKENSAKKLRDLEQKLYTYETHTAKLYEDRCEGIITDIRFAEIVANLEAKRTIAETELATLKQSSKEKSEKLVDIEKWVVLIKEKSSIEDLDRETLEALIDKIEIGESEVIDGKKRQDIQIYYKFVGLV